MRGRLPLGAGRGMGTGAGSGRGPVGTFFGASIACRIIGRSHKVTARWGAVRADRLSPPELGERRRHGGKGWEPMEVFEAIRTMLAVRQYQDRPVPDEVLRRVLEAGRLTASGMNAQPWHFIVVRDRETLRQLGALAKTGPYIAQAPLAIAVAVDRSRLAVSDASRAIHSMLLTAWADGVGGNWVGFGGLDDIKPVLGIPEELDLLAILPLGYPAAEVGRGKKERKPLAEVVSRERYGQPFTQVSDVRRYDGVSGG